MREPELQTRQDTAEQRPFRRQPGVQHPCQGGAHDSNAEPNRPPGMSKYDLAQCHEGALTGWINGHIRGAHQFMKRLEMDPHRWRWISEPSHRKCIRREE